MATTTPAPVEHEHGHPGIVLATLALANVMSVLNLFVVNVALNDIGAYLHSSLSDVAWVLNAYALVTALGRDLPSFRTGIFAPAPTVSKNATREPLPTPTRFLPSTVGRVPAARRKRGHARERSERADAYAATGRLADV